MWPIIRLAQALSPSLRDVVRGCVWEEDGRMVGTTLVQRRSLTDVWIIGDVGVLPAYRRRGIARKLMEATLDLIRSRGGKKAILEVIDGNLPAIRLYEQLGFVHFGRNIVFHASLDGVPPEPALPENYQRTKLAPFDWQPRFQLEKRISPAHQVRYDPVEESRFRQPVIMRLLRPVVMAAQGTRDEEFIIRTTHQNLIVARGGFTVYKRGKGVDHLNIRLDPAHPDLADYMVRTLLIRVKTLSPENRLECSVPQWMEAVVIALETAGFERRMESHLMGIEL